MWKSDSHASPSQALSFTQLNVLYDVFGRHSTSGHFASLPLANDQISVSTCGYVTDPTPWSPATKIVMLDFPEGFNDEDIATAREEVNLRTESNCSCWAIGTDWWRQATRASVVSC